MSYDINGNMTDMPDKGISGISYNFLNLPASMDTADGLSTGNILNLYRADGTKLRKTLTGVVPINGGITTVSVTDYLDGFQYLSTTTSGGEIFVPLAGEEGELDVAMEREAFFAENKANINPPGNAAPDSAVLQFIPTAEGFYDFTENRYIYQYKDHLGNTRLSYAWNTTTSSIDVLDKNDYYPFGMNHLDPDAGSFFGQGSYKNYKFLGEELLETGWYNLNARFYMPDIVIFGQHDPLSEQTLQPYAYGYNNPIMFKYPIGMSGESTHTGKFGNVVAVYNDGDNGVYKHNGTEIQTQAELNSSYSSSSTSGGETKMGETQYWDEFANHDSNGNILGDKTGNFANKDAQIFYGVPIDDYMQKSANYAKLGMEAQGSASSAKDWLATNSARHGKLDIKDRLGAHNGYLLNGKYVSGETAGNYLFGTNLNTLREFATLDNIRYPITNKESVFYRAAEAFGAYHNSSNKVNNPSVRPYYGEIPYSGRGIVNGYYRTTNNPVFNTYPTTAIYDKIKIK